MNDKNMHFFDSRTSSTRFLKTLLQLIIEKLHQLSDISHTANKYQHRASRSTHSSRQGRSHHQLLLDEWIRHQLTHGALICTALTALQQPGQRLLTIHWEEGVQILGEALLQWETPHSHKDCLLG